MKKTIIQATKIVNIIYAIIVLIFLIECFTGFDIKNQPLKSFIYFGFLIGMPIILFWNLFSKRIILILYPILLLILLIVVNPNIIHPIRILYASTVWKTFFVFYEHKQNSCRTIEFQMQDIGALGFNRRTVEVINLTTLFRITKELPNDSDIDENEWILVNKEMDERK